MPKVPLLADTRIIVIVSSLSIIAHRRPARRPRRRPQHPRRRVVLTASGPALAEGLVCLSGRQRVGVRARRQVGGVLETALAEACVRGRVLEATLAEAAAGGVLVATALVEL